MIFRNGDHSVMHITIVVMAGVGNWMIVMNIRMTKDDMLNCF